MKLYDRKIGSLFASLMLTSPIYASDLLDNQNLESNDSLENVSRQYKLKPSQKKDIHKFLEQKVKVFKVEKPVYLPTSIDFRDKCPPVYDQGKLGSCTANALAGAMLYDQIRQGVDEKSLNFPSRLFIYYNERKIEDSIDQDAGASLASGIRTICTDGACREELFPYDDGPYKFKIEPGPDLYKDALNNVDQDDINHAMVNQDLTSIKLTLSQLYPIVFGLQIYNSFASYTVAKSGIVNTPTRKEKRLGGHALMLVGYNDSDERFIVRNSWGANWGQKGYFTVPYDYVTNPKLASDFWVVSKVGPKIPVDVVPIPITPVDVTSEGEDEDIDLDSIDQISPVGPSNLNSTDVDQEADQYSLDMVSPVVLSEIQIDPILNLEFSKLNSEFGAE